MDSRKLSPPSHLHPQLIWKPSRLPHATRCLAGTLHPTTQFCRGPGKTMSRRMSGDTSTEDLDKSSISHSGFRLPRQKRTGYAAQLVTTSAPSSCPPQLMSLFFKIVPCPTSCRTMCLPGELAPHPQMEHWFQPQPESLHLHNKRKQRL